MHVMPDRLSPLDVSFLYFEEPTTPMHVGGVAIFEAPQDGFDHGRLVDLISHRIAFSSENRRDEGSMLGNIGNLFVEQGQVEEALRYYQEALAVLRMQEPMRAGGED